MEVEPGVKIDHWTLSATFIYQTTSHHALHIFCSSPFIIINSALRDFCLTHFSALFSLLFELLHQLKNTEKMQSNLMSILLVELYLSASE